MMSRRTVCLPVVLSLAITCAMGIMLLGGCPQQQIPSAPTTEDPNSTTNTPTETPDITPERPIPGPVIDANDPGTGGDGGSDGTSGGDGGNDGTGGGTGTAAFSVRFDAPLTAIAVRPTTKVDLSFRLTDRQNMVTQVEFVLARDDNEDGKPDGNPVLAKAITSATASGKYAFSAADAPLNSAGFGRFLLGLRVTPSTGDVQTTYASGRLTIDAVAPTATWISPTKDLLSGPGNLQVTVRTDDNSPHTVRIVLDSDTNPANGFAGILVSDTKIDAGAGERVFNVPLSIASGTYYYYFVVSDGIAPATTGYGKIETPAVKLVRLMATNRLNGDFDLNRLADSSDGAILQGFNFNDLGGSSIASVPDMDNDGKDELLIGARFGKPNLASFQGQGWGEAYMIYGGSTRLHGTKYLNSTGSSIPGVDFRGIRTVLNTNWTEGLSDITVIPDMDGDDLPELAFSFPRVESVSLAREDAPFQHPLLNPDLSNMGEMEMDAVDTSTTPPGWTYNLAQFTRGGIVLVSSQNALLTDRAMRTRKFDRVLDLHEVGQLFTGMGRQGLAMYIRGVADFTPVPGGDGYPPCEDCIENIYDTTTECPASDPPELCDPADPTNPACPCECTDGCADCGNVTNNPAETAYRVLTVYWDTWNGADGSQRQGPGGFHMPWTLPSAMPPLSNPTAFSGGLPADEGPCPRGCKITNAWTIWDPLPRTSLADNPAWMVSGASAWTGYYGNLDDGGAPLEYFRNNFFIPPTSVGARVLGESLDDRFGATLSSDGNWLYISAPDHSALASDVPTLPGTRDGSGVVYLLRTNQRTGPGDKNTAQLWVEPGQRWPNPDADLPDRFDFTMPTPHQYIIETVGSWRMNYTFSTHVATDNCISGDQLVSSATDADYSPYPTGTAGYNVDRTPQIVGPDQSTPAHLGFVRALGDLNRDGVRDFAVGSPDIEDPATGAVVGGIYIVYGRPLGFEGHLLLEDLHRAPADPSRLAGIMLKGDNPSAPLARVFDDAGDFNGDGIDDVIVGSDAGLGGNGETIIILGSEILESPENGWTIDNIVDAQRAIRFVGKDGERLGANVAGLGDVDGDGYTDVLIAAPGAAGGRGAVYLVYGSPLLAGDIIVADTVGTFDLPGVRFIGRKVGDQLGGGSKSFAYTTNTTKSFTAYSRGVSALGDLDGDGHRDFAISAMLAAPNGKTDAGEVYVLYGSGD